MPRGFKKDGSHAGIVFKKGVYMGYGFNKESKMSKESIEKRSNTVRGRKRPPYSMEWKRKISESLKRKKIVPPSQKGNTGEKSGHWTGGNSTYYRHKNAPRPRPDKCEICGILGKETKKGLCYDHNHKTGKFRGWLCNNCNLSIGLLKENIQTLKNMIDYIKNDGL